MKRLFYVLLPVVFLFTLVSCSKGEVPKDETDQFLQGVSSIGEQSMDSQAGQALNDLFSKDPPLGMKLKGVPMFGIKNIGSLSSSLSFAKGIEDNYGTWQFDIGSGWTRTDSTYPSDGFLFKWAFLDSAAQAHAAEFLVDSLLFTYPGTDTIPTRIHASLKIDDSVVLWGTYHGTFNGNGNPTDFDAIIELVNIVQYGVEGSNFAYNDPANPDQPTSGTIHFWAIDYTQGNYRIDITITFNNDQSGTIVVTDSNGWEIVVNVAAPVMIGNYIKTDITGEITRDGRHAADIEGTIWNPEDATHKSVIYVIFSDGTKKSLESYNPTGIVKGLFK